MKELSINIINQTKEYCANNYKSLEVVIEKGKGCWVQDVDGKRYLDMLSSYSALNFGHVHPEIINVLISQSKALTLTSRAFYNNVLYKFLKKICELTGKEKVLPMNTGAEAIETALKIIRKWAYIKKGINKDEAEIIVAENNFHGRTISVISFSSVIKYKENFGPLTPGFKIIPYNDPDALEKTITKNTAAFLIEPIQGEGGIIVPDDGYLKKVASICNKNNVLLALDEIQTGLGRTGKNFAFQYENVNPDIIIIGKALGGGVYPVSAVACNDNIMEVIKPGDHGSTFGGNPLAAAIGTKSIEILIRDNLAKKSFEMGKYFKKELKKINSTKIKEVRGKGLLIGVELKPYEKNAMYYCHKLKDKGILCKDTREKIIRFAPPLIINKNEIDFALEVINDVLK